MSGGVDGEPAWGRRCSGIHCAAVSLPDHNRPHDSTFKLVFSRPENAFALLQAKLPAAVVDAIVPDSLEHEPSPGPDDELRERFTDVLMRGRLRDGREVKVYFLLEHQHQPDPWMPLRVLGYLVRIWEDWRHKHPEAVRLPLVIPLVLHQGPGPWAAAQRLDELYDATPELLAALGPTVPRLDLPFLDLGVRTPSMAGEIPGPPLARLTLVLLRGMADPEQNLGDLLEAHATLVVRLLRQPGGKGDLQRLILYGVYVRKRVDVEALSERVRSFAGPEAGKVVMSTAQELIEKGEIQTLRRVLLELLEESFKTVPASAKERVESASVSELNAWTRRVIHAKRLEDVFELPSKPGRRSPRRGKGGKR